jgi:hypothetical protein
MTVYIHLNERQPTIRKRSGTTPDEFHGAKVRKPRRWLRGLFEPAFLQVPDLETLLRAESGIDATGERSDVVAQHAVRAVDHDRATPRDALRRTAADAPLRSCAISITRSDPIIRQTLATPTRAS